MEPIGLLTSAAPASVFFTLQLCPTNLALNLAVDATLHANVIAALARLLLEAAAASDQSEEEGHDEP